MQHRGSAFGGASLLEHHVDWRSLNSHVPAPGAFLVVCAAVHADIWVTLPARWAQRVPGVEPPVGCEARACFSAALGQLAVTSRESAIS